MAKCSGCKKSHLITYPHTDGKKYCRKCYDKVLAKEKKEKKKQKDIKAAKKAVSSAYYYDKKKLLDHLIESWKPRNCKTEAQYTRSLKKHLENEFTPDDIYISSESGLQMSRVDIVIGRKKSYRDFAIELKKDLKSSEFDRLKGQIHTYTTADFNHILIILVGKTEARLETELKKYFKDIKKCYRYSYDLKTIEMIKKK